MRSIIGNTRRPDITFYRNGRIDITSYVTKMLGIHEGDVIDIACVDKEYYLYIRIKGDKIVGRHRGQCFSSKQNSRNFRTYCKRLCEFLFADSECNKIQLAIGTPVEVYDIGKAIPIITRQILSNETRS